MRRWQHLVLVCLILATAGLAVPRRSAHADGPASPYGDDRFGVTLNGDPQQLLTLGVRWFITYDSSSAAAALPPGAVLVQYVPLGSAEPPAANLTVQVEAAPGSYWLLGNEPNVTGSAGELTGAAYARAFHDATVTIKQADPTAMIVAPNLLNFDFTCTACPGYTSGHAWLDSFLAAYAADYGGLPPVDVWAIHTYPLDFNNFPQANASLVEDQLQEFRTYLDAVPGLTGAPIWDTELGTHWGYEGLQWRNDSSGVTKAYPTGAFRTDLLLGYMQQVIGWLQANGPALQINRWFLFASHVATPEPWETVYGGIDLLDGDGPNAQLTPFGQLYRQLAGLSP